MIISVPAQNGGRKAEMKEEEEEEDEKNKREMKGKEKEKKRMKGREKERGPHPVQVYIYIYTYSYIRCSSTWNDILMNIRRGGGELVVGPFFSFLFIFRCFDTRSR